MRYAGIYLVDLIENRTVDITASGSEYTFTAKSTPKPVNRFVILTRSGTDSQDDFSKIKVFGGQNSVLVQNMTDEQGDLLLYDISGRFMKKAKFNPNGVDFVITGLKQGVYVVKASTTSEKVSQQIMVR